jgi:glucose/mannose-6-phosphate isomerase
VAGIDEVVAEGDGPLAQLLDLALFGDFVSLHRAAQEGLDPGPVPALDDLKAALAAD